jgi:hypothetical protein
MKTSVPVAAGGTTPPAASNTPVPATQPSGPEAQAIARVRAAYGEDYTNYRLAATHQFLGRKGMLFHVEYDDPVDGVTWEDVVYFRRGKLVQHCSDPAQVAALVDREFDAAHWNEFASSFLACGVVLSATAAILIYPLYNPGQELPGGQALVAWGGMVLGYFFGNNPRGE